MVQGRIDGGHLLDGNLHESRVYDFDLVAYHQMHWRMTGHGVEPGESESMRWIALCSPVSRDHHASQ